MHMVAVLGHRNTRAAQPHEHGESYCWTWQIFSVVAEHVLVRVHEARQEETDSCKSGGNPQRMKVRMRGSLPRDQQEEKTVRVEALAVEV